MERGKPKNGTERDRRSTAKPIRNFQSQRVLKLERLAKTGRSGTKKKGLDMLKNGAEEVKSLALDQKSRQPEIAETSDNLLKNVSMQLYDLMKKIVSDEVTPKTVSAACSCASEIHKMLKLNRELTR